MPFVICLIGTVMYPYRLHRTVLDKFCPAIIKSGAFFLFFSMGVTVCAHTRI